MRLKNEYPIRSFRNKLSRIDIDNQKTISQTLRFPYNARVYINYHARFV